METRDAIRSVVENIPGICQLMPEQEEYLVHILNGGDVALLPTGFGKSLIYQLLPIVSEKLGRPKSGKAIIVIVSPLVALMDDQVKEAAKLGLCAVQPSSLRYFARWFCFRRIPVYSGSSRRLSRRITYVITKRYVIGLRVHQ